jgi:hypothetical protein
MYITNRANLSVKIIALIWAMIGTAAFGLWLNHMAGAPPTNVGAYIVGIGAGVLVGGLSWFCHYMMFEWVLSDPDC